MESHTFIGAQILWPNFAGKEGPFNEEGKRSFNILIEDPNQANELLGAGWNVKEMKNREEGDPPLWFLPVKVNYKSKYPPRIIKTSSDGSKQLALAEGTVKLLDILRIETADVMINPFEWKTPDGRTGVSAYLDTMYAVTVVNPLDLIWEEKAANSLYGDADITMAEE